jgi:hypothetical protein
MRIAMITSGSQIGAPVGGDRGTETVHPRSSQFGGSAHRQVAVSGAAGSTWFS